MGTWSSRWTAMGFMVGIVIALAQTPRPVDVGALLQEAQQLAAQARSQRIMPSPDVSLWRQAIAKAEQATQADGQNALAWKVLGGLYTETRFWARAETAWQRYLLLTTAQPDAEARAAIVTTYLNLGYAAYRRDEADLAFTHFQNAAQFSPNRPEAFEWLGRIALERGDIAAARGYYQQANAVGPSAANQYFLSQIDSMATYGKPAVRAFLNGYEKYQAGDRPAALGSFEQATQAAPNFLEAWRWVGRTRLELDRPKAALEAWQQVASSPQVTNRDRYFLRLAQVSAQFGTVAAQQFFAGVQAFQAGTRTQAQTHFQAATLSNPQFTDAWYWLGRTAFEQRNFPLAIQAYSEVLKLQPDHKEAQYWLTQARKATP